MMRRMGPAAARKVVSGAGGGVPCEGQLPPWQGSRRARRGAAGRGAASHRPRAKRGARGRGGRRTQGTR